MRIAVLNNSSLKQHHLNSLNKIGEVKIFDRTVGEKEAIERLENIDIAIIDSYDVPITKSLIERLPNLKFICINSTGYENVDIETANKHSLQISNVQDYATHSVAELTIGLLLSLSRKLNLLFRQNNFHSFEIELSDKSHYNFIGNELCNKKLGIIGFGNIGKQVAKIASAFGLEILLLDYPKQVHSKYKSVDFDAFFSQCDFISLNNSFNREFPISIDDNSITKLKPTVIIVNTARGGLIDENIIYRAIVNKKIGGYATDVLFDNSKNNPLLELDNVIVTPHIGFFTEEALINLANIVVANVEAFVSNEPINLITSN